MRKFSLSVYLSFLTYQWCRVRWKGYLSRRLEQTNWELLPKISFQEWKKSHSRMKYYRKESEKWALERKKLLYGDYNEKKVAINDKIGV